MKMTDKVKVGGIWYTIILIPDMKEEDDCSGKAIFGKAKIRLDGSMCLDMKKATTLHEVIEIIDTENEYKLPHHVIQGLATQLYQVIVDNPEMFKNDDPQ
jgi:hypothetical protein